MFKLLIVMWNSFGRFLRRAGSIALVVTPIIAFQIFVTYPDELSPWSVLLGYIAGFSIVLLFVWHLVAEIFLDPERTESKRFFLGFALFSSQLIGPVLPGLMDEIGMMTILFWLIYTALHVIFWLLIAKIYTWFRSREG